MTKSIYGYSQENNLTASQENKTDHAESNFLDSFVNNSMNLRSEPETNAARNDTKNSRKRRSAINDYIKSLYEKTYSQEEVDWNENPFSGRDNFWLFFQFILIKDK